MQLYARINEVPLDTIVLSTDVFDATSENTALPQEQSSDFSVVIYGLFLEGAAWENGMLAECLPKQLYAQLPSVRLRPRVEQPGRPSKFEKDVYKCPVFNTLARSGIFLLKILILYFRPADIIRPVCQLCAHSYSSNY